MSGLFVDDDETAVDFDDESDQPEPRRRWGLVALVVLVLLAVPLALGAWWVQRQVDPPGAPGDTLTVTVPAGATTTEIVEQLAEEGVVTHPDVFGLYLRVTGSGPFDAGEYELRRRSSMGDVVRTLEAGPATVVAGRLTVPEGLTLGEVAAEVGELEQFSAEAFLAAAGTGSVRSTFQPNGVGLEGLLFPETYTLDGQEDEAALLQRMVATFDEVAGRLGYAEAEQRLGRSPYEVIVVASLVEAEAKVDEDRAKIARVIYNRLDEGMTLGIDATVYYALQRRGGSLTETDLAVDNPYNTRRFAGLPPTPIAIPGEASLRAALEPEPGPWLYYVLADAEGVHAFSESYDEFLDNKAEAERQGLIP